MAQNSVLHLRRLPHDHDSKAAVTHAGERRSSKEARKPAACSPMHLAEPLSAQANAIPRGSPARC